MLELKQFRQFIRAIFARGLRHVGGVVDGIWNLTISFDPFSFDPFDT